MLNIFVTRLCNYDKDYTISCGERKKINMMKWQVEHLFEIKLKQEQHFLIPGPFVHPWHIIFFLSFIQNISPFQRGS